jgi:hypothetical protein
LINHGTVVVKLVVVEIAQEINVLPEEHQNLIGFEMKL